jgi:3(or 17)beta-hydroxysteroid dehydrogenase
MRAMPRVENKIAIVTGAASGLGLASARMLAREGATVVLTDRNAEAGARAADELGAPHRFRALDVTVADAWTAVVDETVAAFGRLDVLVNSAGMGIVGDIETATLKDLRLMQAVNVEGVFLGCQNAIRVMKATGGGSIINVSSVAGLIGEASLAGYCASKGAVRLLTKSVALHAARKGYGIRCNSVHPSFIDTPMVQSMCEAMSSKDPAKARERLTQAAPLGRLGEPDEVAYLVVYLASDESRFTTGAELVIDGGLTAR